MAVAQLSASLFLSIRDTCTIAPSRLSVHSFSRPTTSFITGSPLALRRAFCGTKAASKTTRQFSIRCEQSSQGSNSLDVWIGRLAMVGFTVAISVEIATGKGLLENFGLVTPLPIAALAVTGLAGFLIALFIFQSAAKK